MIPSHIFRSQPADWYRGYHGAALEQPAKPMRGLAIRTNRNPRGGTCDDLPQPLRCSAVIVSHLAELLHGKMAHVARRSARSCCPSSDRATAACRVSRSEVAAAP